MAMLVVLIMRATIVYATMAVLPVVLMVTATVDIGDIRDISANDVRLASCAFLSMTSTDVINHCDTQPQLP